MSARQGQVSAKYCQLFCCTRILVWLISIIFVNITIRWFANGFKNNIYNLHFGFNICDNFCTYIILAPCLTNFNCHLGRNNSLSI